jgi:MEDS: MEthanogen/methylotroph, DcmR Sensory domain
MFPFHSTADTLRDLEPGTHAILIYDTKENKRRVLFDHLRYGMKDEQLVYVCSEESPHQVREEMGRSGMDVEGLEGKGALSIQNYDNVYIKNGEVDIPGIINGFSEYAKASTTKGYKGMRAAAEMSCFFQADKVRELEEYENALNRRFSFPGKGLCGYNMVEMYNSGHMDVAFPIMRAHAVVILTGPNGSMVFEPEEVNKDNFAQVMQVKV